MSAAMSTNLRTLVADVLVIPVIVIDDIAHAVPLARALHAVGLDVLEVTLRTPAALPAIAAIASEVPEAKVGAGTVLTPDDARRAADAGACFVVSPGYTDELDAACRDLGLPWLPGIATASDAMRLLSRGYDFAKFFPAAAAGGVAMLRALAGPFPGLSFCPTGGIDAANAADFLALPNVPCVGGSWVVPREAVHAGRWEEITALARSASLLR